MNKAPNQSILEGNIFELHYWFEDKSHTMDAIIQNKCESELLGVIKELAAILGASIIIETEPLAEGGLKRWFKILSKEENKKSPITVAVITALAVSIFATPITTSITKITEKTIETLYEDKETKDLEKEKIKLEIEKIKQ